MIDGERGGRGGGGGDREMGKGNRAGERALSDGVTLWIEAAAGDVDGGGRRGVR